MNDNLNGSDYTPWTFAPHFAPSLTLRKEAHESGAWLLHQSTLSATQDKVLWLILPRIRHPSASTKAEKHPTNFRKSRPFPLTSEFRRIDSLSWLIIFCSQFPPCSVSSAFLCPGLGPRKLTLQVEIGLREAQGRESSVYIFQALCFCNLFLEELCPITLNYSCCQAALNLGFQLFLGSRNSPGPCTLRLAMAAYPCYSLGASTFLTFP